MTAEVQTPINEDSVRRALNHHQAQGTIRTWSVRDDGMFLVDVAGAPGPIYEGDLVATHALVVGIAAGLRRTWEGPAPSGPIPHPELTVPLTAQEAADRAGRALREYSYWSERAREYAAAGNRDSESYRAAAQMASRAIGQHDVWSRIRPRLVMMEAAR